MRRAYLTAGLWLGIFVMAQAAESTGNPRGYPVDILAQTFGYGQQDVDVSLGEIFQGCPQRDCIPSIDEPLFAKASEVADLSAGDLLLVVEYRGVAKAYPTRYLDVHEIVNDEFAGAPVVVTYCPLCGSGLAFERTVDGEVTEFGVSGLLHNNDLIMYDRATESLWQQITGESFAGPRKGTHLEPLPLTMSSWHSWRDANPEAWVLKPPNGAEAYARTAYDGYSSSDRLLFPVKLQDARLHPKKPVIGVVVGDQAIAIDAQWLVQDAQRGQWSHRVGGEELRVEGQPDGGVHAYLSDERIPAHRMYWFAWYSFHPRTALIPSEP